MGSHGLISGTLHSVNTCVGSSQPTGTALGKHSWAELSIYAKEDVVFLKVLARQEAL